MGQTLSYPGTAKRSETGQDERCMFAVVDMQGWRIGMEDAHAAVLNLEEQEGAENHNSFFAVYDGHGGSAVAKYAGQNVHKRLVTEDTYKQKDYGQALKHAFLGIDEDLLANPANTRESSGCTAVAALVTNENKIYVANAGDSRAVLSTAGQVKNLSFDHKPSNDTERARITAAGGYIEYGRVNGNLALSRALGDFEFKKNANLGPEQQVITADPDLLIHDITDEDEFIIIACDGIWDCLSSQQAVDFVRYQVYEGKDLKEIGENMCEHCLAPDTTSGAGIGCDNMTVLIVALLHGRTKEEWYSWIHDRVRGKHGYDTPNEPPQLYSPIRLRQFRARREIMESRGPDKAEPKLEQEENGLASFLGSAGLGGFARVLGSTGGMSFAPGSGIMNTNGGLMFGSDDSDDDDSLDEEMSGAEEGSSIFTNNLGLNGTGVEDDDSTSRLKARLAEFEKDLDGDTNMEDSHPKANGPVTDGVNGEAPPPPIPEQHTLPNGDAKGSVKQLKSEPLGDEPIPVVKAEGLLDKSEDPVRVSSE